MQQTRLEQERIVNDLLAQETNEIIYLADFETYELLYLNRACLRTLNYPAERDWKGKPCYQVLQGRNTPCPFCPNSKLRFEQVYEWEHYNSVVGRAYLARDKLIKLDGRTVHFEIATDVTSWPEVARDLEQQLLTEETLNICIKTLNQTQDMHQAVLDLLRILCDYHQARCGYIYEFDEDHQHMKKTFEWYRDPKDPLLRSQGRLTADLCAPWIKAFEQEGELFLRSDDAQNSTFSDTLRLMREIGIQRLVAAPMVTGGEVVGFLGVDDPTRHCESAVLLRSVAYFANEDIARRKMTDQLTYLCYTDTLTGVYNRNKYKEKLSEFDIHHPKNLGVVFADINGLKRANDTYGHQYGDYLITYTAEVLTALFGEFVYRIGGDEFVVMIPEIPRSLFDEKVSALYTRIKRDSKCNISLGSNWSDRADTDVRRMIMHADELMYIDKQKHYSADAGSRSFYHTEQVQKLQRELNEGVFTVYLQPKVELATCALSGAEALVRRISESGELLLPQKFIPLYEAEGIVRYVDFYVLSVICRTLEEWHAKGYPPIAISVNLSRVTLMEQGILEKLLSVCEEYHVPPTWLKIEVTEGIGTMETDELTRLVSELQAVGFGISLDDFGTRYSNLSILTTIDFDEIKLDKSLIDFISENRKSRITAQHIIDMCAELEIRPSVAEGIETQDQLEVLRALNCDLGQGFFFDRPMTITAFAEKYLKK